jgi:hypothetical protein
VGISALARKGDVEPQFPGTQAPTPRDPKRELNITHSKYIHSSLPIAT